MIDIRSIMQKTKEAIESMYQDTCNIIEWQPVTDPETKKTTFHEVTVYENKPCKVSFGSVSPSTSGEAAEQIQTVKLFISCDINIKPGSKIVVTREGYEPVAYSNSGKPSTFTNHQEIALKLFERWS